MEEIQRKKIKAYNFFFLVGCTWYHIQYPYSSSMDDLHLYTWATYNSLNKNNTTATSLFRQLLNKPSPPVYAYNSYIEHLFNINQYRAIIDLEPIIETTLSHLVLPTMLLIKSFEIMGNSKKADHYLHKTHQKYPTNPELTYLYVLSLIRMRKMTQALTLITNYLQNAEQDKLNFLFYFLCAQIHAGMNNFDMASAYIEKTTSLNPAFAQGWLFSALLKEMKGDIAQALDDYAQCSGLHGISDRFVQ